MYGRYTKDLGEYAKNEARKLKMLERRRKKEDKARDRVNINFPKKLRPLKSVDQQFCLNNFPTGTIRKAYKSFCTVYALDMEKYVCQTWRRLGVFGFIRNYHGSFILYYG